MKTEELIEWLEDMKVCGCAIYPNEEEIIMAIIKTLKDYDKLRKLYGMSDDRGN